jgi:hypothetical protein
MNQDSSRSHSIFTITIEATERYNSNQPGKQYAPIPAARSFTIIDICRCLLVTSTSSSSSTGFA